jgi:hypothetical protein
MSNDDKNYSDDYFNVVSLPMDKQHATTAEERKEFFENLKKQLLGEKKPDIVTDRPLTTDVIKRGYPAKKEELDTIEKINNREREILANDSSAKPIEDNSSKYFIVENGKVFKETTDGLYYELDTDSMEWDLNQDYMSLRFDTYLKFSELKNFRDYYLEKENKEEENRGFPR